MAEWNKLHTRMKSNGSGTLKKILRMKVEALLALAFAVAWYFLIKLVLA